MPVSLLSEIVVKLHDNPAPMQPPQRVIYVGGNGGARQYNQRGRAGYAGPDHRGRGGWQRCQTVWTSLEARNLAPGRADVDNKVTAG
ncbi:hypothetical protein K503DRAFT_776918 [Rhizopogon vinicolor AM-OR11-026]|uniref:Uncharacterized protein n=1 Tax=Rhizopogon vinicolor AM-OR11-026 TaxID=1314800 RepID=A0A1B7MHV1_9AGAM|nr:hypothetical protein K503DRAFT_776918 [Rhizopogon vinicolor AM-OR11-026]